MQISTPSPEGANYLTGLLSFNKRRAIWPQRAIPADDGRTNDGGTGRVRAATARDRNLSSQPKWQRRSYGARAWRHKQPLVILGSSTVTHHVIRTQNLSYPDEDQSARRLAAFSESERGSGVLPVNVCRGMECCQQTYAGACVDFSRRGGRSRRAGAKQSVCRHLA